MEKIEREFPHYLYSTRREELSTIFTSEDFNDEEDLIAKTTEQFIKQDVLPYFSSIEQHDYNVVRKLFQKAGELGLLGIEVPDVYGGLSLDKKISGLVAEKMGFGGSFSVSFNIHVGVGTLPYVYFGSENQKQKYLPKLASGEWIGAYALTEPDAGSDALHPKTTAVLNKEGTMWLLNGAKQWITNAQVADVYVVFANTSEGITAFIVERSFGGVSIGPEEEKMGIKGSSTATLMLDDVLVPNENVLGIVGKGHKVALNVLNLARLKLAFSNIGTSKQALQLAVDYGKERKQFDRSIVDFTMIQEKLANMATAIYGVESAAYRTTGELDDAINAVEERDRVISKIADFAMECAINKVNCSEVLGEIVDEAVQIHGGYGYMQEYEVERLYRDARISRIFEGTNEINRLTIAKELVKKYAQVKLGTPEIYNEVDLGRNHQFVYLANYLLRQSLKAISNMKSIIAEEQEYLHLLANIVKEVYIMESSLLRTEKLISNDKHGGEPKKAKQLMNEVLCEEGYRKVEEATVSIFSSIETVDTERKRRLDEIRHLPIPLYHNLFLKKREIARIIINRPQYLK
jgi:alkylation response protein AidB-like acyl-CoA dehydrogenase